MEIWSGAEKWIGFSLDLNWFSWVGLTFFPVLCRTYILLRSTMQCCLLSLDPEFGKPQFHVPSCHLEQLIPSGITWYFCIVFPFDENVQNLGLQEKIPI